MILVIRIAGMVNMDTPIQEGLHRLRLRRKYAAVLLKDTSENRKLLAHLRDYVAFGTVSEELVTKLLTARGKSLDGKPVKVSEVVKGLSKKSLQELGVKPFFRLHPPRGGIESKKHYGVGKGILGDNKDNIGALVERML